MKQQQQQNTAPDNFYIYARVSSDDQANNDSLPSQVVACRRYVQYAFNVDIPDSNVILDDESGMTLERPGLNKLRALLRKQRNVALIINSSDRLSRKPIIGEELFEEFQKYGTRLFIVLHNRELRMENQADRNILLMEMGFNRQWHYMLREGMVRGRNAAIERGSVVVGGPRKYGYDKERIDKRTIEYIIVPEEAKVIQNIFEWYVIDRLPVSKIRERLHGTPTPNDLNNIQHSRRKRTFGEWSLGTIYMILRDDAFIGNYSVNQGDNVYQAATFDIPPIISNELFESAQERLDNGKKLSRRNTGITDETFMLARRIHCACGYAIHTPWSENQKQRKKYFYYRCATDINQSNTAAGKCGLPYFKQSLVDDAIWLWLVDKCKDPRGLTRILQESKEHADTQNARLYERLGQIDQIRARMLRELENLLSAQSKATAPNVKALFDRKIEEANELDNELSEEEDTIKAQLSQATLSQSYVNQWNHDAREIQEDLPIERRRFYMERLNISATLAFENGCKMVYVHIHAHTEPINLDTHSVSVSTTRNNSRHSHRTILTFRIPLPSQ